MKTLEELKSFVVSTNVYLKDVVETMSPVLLLRNVQPMYCSELAYKLWREGVITKNEAVEFTKVI